MQPSVGETKGTLVRGPKTGEGAPARMTSHIHSFTRINLNARGGWPSPHSPVKFSPNQFALVGVQTMQPLSGPSIQPTFSLACTFPNSKSTCRLPPGKTGKVTAPHSSTLPLRVCLCPAQHKECMGILIRGKGGKRFPLCTRSSWGKIRASFPWCHHSSLPACSGKDPNRKKKMCPWNTCVPVTRAANIQQPTRTQVWVRGTGRRILGAGRWWYSKRLPVFLVLSFP